MQMLKRDARLGMVKTKARTVMMANGEERHDVALPEVFWGPPPGLLGIAEPHHSEDWKDGDFEGCGGQLFDRWAARGVGFSRAEIDRRYPSLRSPSARRAPTIRLKWDWDAAKVALRALGEREDLIKRFGLGRRGGQAKVEAWLSEWFEAGNGGTSPSESEIRKRASSIVCDLLKA